MWHHVTVSTAATLHVDLQHIKLATLSQVFHQHVMWFARHFKTQPGEFTHAKELMQIAYSTTAQQRAWINIQNGVYACMHTCYLYHAT